MIIKMLKKTEIIDFFTYDPMVYEFFKISNGSNFFPDWWKNIPNKLYIDGQNTPSFEIPTMKKCPGLTELYKQSFVMPLWTDIDIQVKGRQCITSVSDRMTKIDSHDKIQRGSYLNPDKYHHLKIITPWVAKTKSKINFLISSCSFSNEAFIDSFFVPNGFRSFNISSSTNVHGFTRVDYDHNFTLESATPLIHLFPLTDKKVKVRCHLDKDEFQKISMTQPDRFSFNGGYYKKKRLLNP